jgi:hypothetical protein
MYFLDGICHVIAQICIFLLKSAILLLKSWYCFVQMAESVEEVPDVGATTKKPPKVMTWTPPMSACMLRSLADIAAKGVKTDKGFKEIHITKAAKALTELVGYEVTTTQVTNHLRKWKVRYQRIEKLRLLSGALWDNDRKMILLEEQHYLGHTQVCM